MSEWWLFPVYFLMAAVADGLYTMHGRAIADRNESIGPLLSAVTAGMGLLGLGGVLVVNHLLAIPFVLGCYVGTKVSLHYKLDKKLGDFIGRFTTKDEPAAEEI